jgi:hypothetical protein
MSNRKISPCLKKYTPPIHTKLCPHRTTRQLPSIPNHAGIFKKTPSKTRSVPSHAAGLSPPQGPRSSSSRRRQHSRRPTTSTPTTGSSTPGGCSGRRQREAGASSATPGGQGHKTTGRVPRSRVPDIRQAQPSAILVEPTPPTAAAPTPWISVTDWVREGGGFASAMIRSPGPPRSRPSNIRRSTGTSKQQPPALFLSVVLSCWFISILRIFSSDRWTVSCALFRIVVRN